MGQYYIVGILLLVTGCSVDQVQIEKAVLSCEDHGGVFEIFGIGVNTASVRCRDGLATKLPTT